MVVLKRRVTECFYFYIPEIILMQSGNDMELDFLWSDITLVMLGNHFPTVIFLFKKTMTGFIS